jgi:hypothetical protein
VSAGGAGVLVWNGRSIHVPGSRGPGLTPNPYRGGKMPVTVDQIRELAASLPRSHEAIVRGRVKFRVGQIVYLSLAADGSTMGCGFPKEFRQDAVDAEPEKFSLPSESDMRFNWIHVNLDAIDHEEMRDLVEDAWSRCVPKYVAREYADASR